MNADRPFPALIIASSGVVGLVGLALWQLAGQAALSVPPGLVLTWCGRLLGSIFGLGGVNGNVALGVAALVLGMVAAGTAALLASLWTTGRVVRRLTAEAVPAPPEVAALASELGIADRLVVSASSGLFSFCFGARRPRVCVSAGLVEALAPGELRAVLAHERHHLVQRDPCKTLCAGALSALSFPFPLVWALRRAYLVARELDADRAAMAVAGRVALASALRKVLTHPETLKLDHVAGLSSFSATAARLDQIVRPEARCTARIGNDVLLVTLTTATLFIGGGLALRGGSVAGGSRDARPSQAPIAPLMCHTLWGTCDGNMGARGCCVTPVTDEPRSGPIVNASPSVAGP